MALPVVWPANKRVALKETTKYRGVVMSVQQPYNDSQGTVLYMVRWTGFTQDYAYIAEMLVDADTIEDKPK